METGTHVHEAELGDISRDGKLISGDKIGRRSMVKFPVRF